MASGQRYPTAQLTQYWCVIRCTQHLVQKLSKEERTRETLEVAGKWKWSSGSTIWSLWTLWRTFEFHESGNFLYAEKWVFAGSVNPTLRRRKATSGTKVKYSPTEEKAICNEELSFYINIIPRVFMQIFRIITVYTLDIRHSQFLITFYIKRTMTGRGSISGREISFS